MKGQLDLKQFHIARPNTGTMLSKGEGSAVYASLDDVSKNQRKRDVLAGIEKLPTLPNIVHEVIRLTNDPRPAAGDANSWNCKYLRPLCGDDDPTG